MNLKFLAVTMPDYSGPDGKANLVSMKKGDTFEFPESIAVVLLRKYPRDFAEVKEGKAEHAPNFDKQYKKNSNYKGK